MKSKKNRIDREEPAGGPLAGRTVLVTGGAHRVGGAISRYLGSQGARVVVSYHASSEAADELVAGLPAGGCALAADLTAPDGAAGLLERSAAAGALPDAVVHSAASFLHRGVLDTTPAEWDRVFALNTRAFFLLAQAFARRHGVEPGGAWADGVAGGEAGGEDSGEAGREGDRLDLSLVVISDSGALELWPGYAAHCVSKAALEPLVKVLARAFSPRVRVNAVMPGPVLPPPDSSPEHRRGMAERTLLKRIGDPEDVARAVAFVLANDFITGVTLPVTGGSHLWRGRLDP